jgi:hypothetical protein
MKLKFQVSSKANTHTLTSDCLIIFTSDLNKLALPKDTITYLKQIIKQEDFSNKTNLYKSIILFKIPVLKADRLLLINISDSIDIAYIIILTYFLSIFETIIFIKFVF